MWLPMYGGGHVLACGEAGDLDGSARSGLYFRETRYVSTLELRLAGRPLIELSADHRAPGEATWALTNAGAGERANRLVVWRRRVLDETLRETLDVDCWSDEPVALELALRIDADFALVYEAQGAARRRAPVPPGGRVRREHDRDGTLHLVHLDGGHTWETVVKFSRAPRHRGDEARFELRATHGERWRLDVEIETRLSSSPPARSSAARVAELVRGGATVETDPPRLGAAYARAARDVAELRALAEAQSEGALPVAAGVPWYPGFFARDALATALQTLHHDPSLARATLLRTAALVGQRTDASTGEMPGRIAHAHRPWPLPGSDPPPRTHWSSVDATPLFVVVLDAYARATGDLDLVRELREPLAAALAWCVGDGDQDRDGLVDYDRAAEGSNQGWKDSPDAVRFRDGRVARGRIALVAVQGYAADAFARASSLWRLLGRAGEADRWADEASRMRERLVRAFWMPDEGRFAQALDGEGRRVDGIASDPGHLLWSRAVDEARAARIIEALTSDEMFAGWGVRTRASSDGGFDPVSYHNGSVWPFDGMLIADGMAAYGRRDAAARVVAGLLAALQHTKEGRLPELLAGYPASVGMPVAYAEACSPQAWSSGAVIQMAQLVVGLAVDAPARRVGVSPLPLDGLGRLSWDGVAIAGARASVRLDGDRVEVAGLPRGFVVER